MTRTLRVWCVVACVLLAALACQGQAAPLTKNPTPPPVPIVPVTPLPTPPPSTLPVPSAPVPPVVPPPAPPAPAPPAPVRPPSAPVPVPAPPPPAPAPPPAPTPPPTYTLAVNGQRFAGQPLVLGNGNTVTATPSSSGGYAAGTEVTLTITLGPGQAFTRWTGDCAGTVPTCTFTIRENRSVLATFQPARYTLTINGERVRGGQVFMEVLGGAILSIGPAPDADGKYEPGKPVALSIYRLPGYTFAGWSGGCVSSQTSCTVMLDGNKAVNVLFIAPIGVRSYQDRTDDFTGEQIHVVYMRQGGTGDTRWDLDNGLIRSTSAMQRWLSGQAQGATLRLDTYSFEDQFNYLDMTFMVLPKSDAQITSASANLFTFIAEELQKIGLNDPNKLYLVYYTGAVKDGEQGQEEGRCGQGGTVGGIRLATVYIGASPSGNTTCFPAYAPPSVSPSTVEYFLLHNTLHALGFVPSCSPHHKTGTIGGHVTDDANDLMFERGPFGVGAGEIALDKDKDDYYAHTLPICPDLLKNPFIRLRP